MNDLTDTAVSDNETQLKKYLARESEALLKNLRLYVWRSGLAEGSAVQDMAADLLNEVVVEALNHADRFQAGRQPKAWLLGIAANLIRRRQTAVIKKSKREPLVQDLTQTDYLDDDEIFDRLTAIHTPSPDGMYEMNETVTAVLSQLTADEQKIITCAVLLEMNGKTLAQTLGVKPGTARMRLHRALNRLRQIWLEMDGEEGETDA